MKNNRIFGTDGIRGVFNQNLTPELAFEVGKALAFIFTNKLESPTLVIAKDTRCSSDILVHSLASGAMNYGANIIYVGLAPTAALAYLTKHLKGNMGVMITASHNVAKDNGIKIFNGNGYKLTLAQELQIEEFLTKSSEIEPVKNEELGRFFINEEALQLYKDYLIGTTKETFKGLNICLDTANGAGSVVALEVLEALGCNVSTINNSLDGKYINYGCGATDLTSLSNQMLKENFDIGFALDGDADRLVCVDKNAQPINPEKIIFLLAKKFKEKKKLKHNTFVGTIISEFALEHNLKKEGIKLLRTPVGDKYIVEAMLEGGFYFGAEGSGHFVLMQKEIGATVDGILSMIKILELLKENNYNLKEKLSSVNEYPKRVYNVKVPLSKKDSIMKSALLLGKIEKIKNLLLDKGLIVVRASGTESLIRIVVEGEDYNLVENSAKELKEMVEGLIE